MRKPILLVHWVTVRDWQTGNLVDCFSFTSYERAEIKRIEQEKKCDPEQFVSIETMNPEFVHYPPEVQTPYRVATQRSSSEFKLE